MTVRLYMARFGLETMSAVPIGKLTTTRPLQIRLQQQAISVMCSGLERNQCFINSINQKVLNKRTSIGLVLNKRASVRSLCRCSWDIHSEGGNSYGPKNFFTHTTNIIKKVITYILRAFLSAVIFMSVSIVVTPAILSSSYGRQIAVGLFNQAIPGHVDVQAMSLGWFKPIVIDGISLKGRDGEIVLSIEKVETKASLWLLIRRKAGLGDCTVSRPSVDLQEDKSTGLLKIALAIVPADRIHQMTSKGKASHSRVHTKPIPSMDLPIGVSVKAPAGGLIVIDGKIKVPDDVAATLGNRVLIDVLLGTMAVDDDDLLRKTYQSQFGLIPAKFVMWSECTHAQGIGFISLKKMLIRLIQPVLIEMDLSPAVAQVYLARINPLLSEVVGPAVQEDDLPDATITVTPENLIIPAENFKISVQPMRAVLARGPLAGGILNLLSRIDGKVVDNQDVVNIQTSAIQSVYSMDGTIHCSRVDILIADKVAIATWGKINWIDEGLEMTLAIPSSTFQGLFGMTLPENFNLEIPLEGYLNHPKVDWKAAALNLGQLLMRYQSSKFLRHLQDAVRSTGS